MDLTSKESPRTRSAIAQFIIGSLLGCLALLAAGSLVGCFDSGRNLRAELRRKEIQEAPQLALSEVIETFNHLYDFINLELEPAVAVLDKSKTFDGEPALARFTPNPATEAPFSNYFTITSRNVRLKSLGVQPGDQVQYFIVDDETDPNREQFLEAMHMADLGAVSRTVAQVVDDEHLIVEGASLFAMEVPHEVQIWRYADDRVQDILERLGAYGEYADPQLGWEPSPDEVAIEQAVNRLNAWMRHTHPSQPIDPPPLLDTLPASIRSSRRLAPHLSLASDGLGRVSFKPDEGRLIQQAIWLRNISTWARGDAVGDLELAKALFDWTVRHIQLEDATSPESAHHLAREPWEILLYGTGTAEQRAWIFTLLCQQQGLPAVVLGVPGDEAESAPLRFWSAAVLSKDRLYLFDPALGLPIPGREDDVATLDEAAADPQILRQLDLDDSHVYPWSQDDAQRVVAMVPASPLSLSRRAALLQEQLIGQAGFVLAADPALVVELLAPQNHVQEVVLWSWPFETLDRKVALALPQGRAQRTRAAMDFRPFALHPHLWKARALHFRGPTAAAEGIGATQRNAEPKELQGLRDAIGLYQTACASDRELAAERSDTKRQTMAVAKQNATYWLGLLKMDQGDYKIAINSWLKRQVIESAASTPWRPGARYNAARAYEALGQADEAIALYEKDNSLQQYGNQLRARWLREGRPLSSHDTPVLSTVTNP